jgi:hypothetical protein
MPSGPETGPEVLHRIKGPDYRIPLDDPMVVIDELVPQSLAECQQDEYR